MPADRPIGPGSGILVDRVHVSPEPSVAAGSVVRGERSLGRSKWLGGRCVVLCLAALTAVSGEWALGQERARPNPEKRAQSLLNPLRDQDMKPKAVVEALGLEPGQAVADIGSGPGYFTLPLARAVGPAGRVYGVDIEPYFLTELQRVAELSNLPQVVPILTTPDSPGLPPASVDVAFFCSVYRHIADRVDYLRKLRVSLKPGGRIVVLEWRKIDVVGGERRFVPRPHPPESEKIDREQVVRELLEAGFEVLEEPEFLEYHFFIIAG